MNCDGARDNMILAAYGELPDQDAIGLEQHLSTCEHCCEEREALRQMDEFTRLYPMGDPNPNLLAQARMRLDEELDSIPQHGLRTRLTANLFAWFHHLQSAPALATLLVGIGFLAGNFTYRYQVAHMPVQRPAVVLTSVNGGGVSNITGINQLSSDMVQVSYNRVVPEMAEGSLNDPQIRQLLMVGTQAATTNGIRVNSVALLANACRAGQSCQETADGLDIRSALLASLRADKNPGVRLKALEGLQPLIPEDAAVRDAVLQALLNDSSAAVRTRAITILEPVDSDTSVRQALRTVSTNDANPYIRTVSTQVLAGVSSLQ
jgi:hypothetical protein